MNHTMFLLMVGCWIGGLAGLLTKGLISISHFSAADPVQVETLDQLSTR